MPGIFDGKIFNGEVFKGFVDRLPNPNKTELIKSRAIRPRPDLAAAMADQDGGNYITTTLRGLISGSVPQNYDGATNISPSATENFAHSRVVVGRMNGWTEKDFAYDVTGGEDPLENVAQQISEYWDEIDQATIVSILKGVFAMSDTEGAKFVTEHTFDVTENAATTDIGAGCMSGTTLNTAMQRACGDNKGKFSLCIMHSMVATNLENLKLLAYLKYTDAQGIERDLALASLNGRLVMVDDSMPVEDGYIESTSGATGALKVVASGASTGEVNLADVKATDFYPSGVAANDYVLAITRYTTFVLGDGAIEYTDCGAKVPYEVDRDPKTNGGQDTLYSRQRKCFAPYGISFTKASMSSLSPTDAELENGANWELVSNLNSGSKHYISRKTIPIARILSRG